MNRRMRALPPGPGGERVHSLASQVSRPEKYWVGKEYKEQPKPARSRAGRNPELVWTREQRRLTYPPCSAASGLSSRRTALEDLAMSLMSTMR